MSLQEIYGRIEPTDTRKINTVLGLYDHYVNGKEISARLNMTKPGRMTPMMFELDRKSTRLNSSHSRASRMPSSA